MKVPKRFKLFNHTYNVIYENDMHKNRDLWGESRYRRKEIALDPNIDKGYLEQTFLHELTHLIFNSIGEHELSANERIVNTFSELLYQAIETMEYKK